jgi:hypothetical protein
MSIVVRAAVLASAFGDAVPVQPYHSYAMLDGTRTLTVKDIFAKLERMTPPAELPPRPPR